MPRIVRSRDGQPNLTRDSSSKATDGQLLLNAVSLGVTLVQQLISLAGGVINRVCAGSIARPLCSDAANSWI